MRRRLVLLLVLALAATGCDYREILHIDADGSATLRVEFTLDRSNHPEGIWPYMLDWDAADEIDSEVEADPRQFMIELFALEGTEPWIDDAVDGFVLDIDDSGLRMELDWEIDDLRSAGSDDTVFDRSVVLTDADVRESDDGTMSLSAPARDSAATFLTDYFSLENDPFVDRDRTGGSPVSVSAEIVVPGDVLQSDAHDRDGNRLSWTWEFGRAGEPGVELRWEPDGGGSSDWDVCQGFAPICYTVLILFGLLVIGVLAATLGLFEAVRVTRRDRRDTPRPDGSP